MTYPFQAFLDALQPDLEDLGELLQFIGGTYRMMEISRGDEPTAAEIEVIERVTIDEYGVSPLTLEDT